MRLWLSYNITQPLALWLLGWKRHKKDHWIFGRQWVNPDNGEVLAQRFAVMAADRKIKRDREGK